MGTMLEMATGALLRASWQAAILVAVVLAAQFLLRGRLSPRWRHALWFIMVARLLLPVAPPSSFSIFNWLKKPVVIATASPATVPPVNPEPIFEELMEAPLPAETFTAPPEILNPPEPKIKPSLRCHLRLDGGCGRVAGSRNN